MVANDNMDFVAILRKSGLVSENELTEALARFEGEPDGKAISDRLVSEGIITRYQAKQLLQGVFRGFFINDKYKVLEAIGRGGMGHVYLCEHVLMKRLVALKVLPKEQSENSVAIERFLREARAVAQLDHPNIVRAHDFERSAKMHFLVMEFVLGVNLHEYTQRRGPLDVIEASHYISQSALGLQHAHERGWVHRDIKPGNLLLDRTGIVKILDMGLARLFRTDDKSNQVTRTNEANAGLLGTADFMSPEQVRAGIPVDIRTDIYALGATFYFLLTGQVPHPTDNLLEKVVAIYMDPVRPIEEFRDDVPPEISAIIMTMLAKNPEDRFQQPVEIALELRPWTEVPIPPPEPHFLNQYSEAVQKLVAEVPADARSTWASIGTEPILDVNDALSRRAPAPQYDDLLGKLESVREGELNLNPGGSGRIAARGARSSEGTAPDYVGMPTMRMPRRPAQEQESPQEFDAEPSDEYAEESVRAVFRTDVGLEPRRPLATRLLDYLKSHPMIPVGVTVGFLVVMLTVMAIAKRNGWNGNRPGPVVAEIVPPPPWLEYQGRTFYVARQGNRPFDDGTRIYQTSIKQALKEAAAGDKILVCDEIWEENLVLDETTPKLVTIAADPKLHPVRCVWRSSLDQAKKPLLQMTGCDGLRIHGFVMEGSPECERIVTIQGKVPRVRFQNLFFRSFASAAVEFADASGEAGEDRLVIQSSTFRSLTNDAAKAVPIRFTSSDPSAGNRHLVVANCRFEGPFDTFAKISGKVEDITFYRDRFHDARTAFEIVGDTPANIQVLFGNNTIVKCSRSFLDLPNGLGSNSRIVLQNNLVLQTQTMSETSGIWSVDKYQQLFAGSQGNICHAESCSNYDIQGMNFKPFVFQLWKVSQDRESSRFLQYDPDNSLSRAGPGESPVGVPPDETP